MEVLLCAMSCTGIACFIPHGRREVARIHGEKKPAQTGRIISFSQLCPLQNWFGRQPVKYR